MFLRVNGIQLAVGNATLTQKSSRTGKRARTFRGQMRDARRGIRRSWDMELVIRDFEGSEGIIRMVNGEGHMVDFTDGFQAATGLVPRRIDTPVILDPSMSGAFNTNGVLVIKPTLIGADDEVLSYDPQFGDQWTVLVQSRSGTTGWSCSALCSDGRRFRNGIASTMALKRGVSPEGVYASVLGGAVDVFRDSTLPDATLYLDDFIMLPYRMTDSMLAQLTTSSTKFGACPTLRCVGDIFGGHTVVCVGEVSTINFSEKPNADGVWLNNARVTRLTLSEMSPTFMRGVDEEPVVPVITDNGFLGEDLTSQIDGVTQTFTTAYPQRGYSLAVFIDGINQNAAADGYVVQVGGNTFTIADVLPVTTQSLFVLYVPTHFSEGFHIADISDQVDGVSTEFIVDADATPYATSLDPLVFDDGVLENDAATITQDSPLSGQFSLSYAPLDRLADLFMRFAEPDTEVIREVLTAQVDGSATVFLPTFCSKPGMFTVLVDGVLQPDATQVGPAGVNGRFQLSTAPAAGQKLSVLYVSNGATPS